MSYGNTSRDSRDTCGPTLRDLASERIVRPMDIDYNNPPCVPRLNVPGELVDDFPYICAVVADELTRCAEMTPAHMFLYNVTASKGFDNSEFDGVLTAVLTSVDAVMANTNPLPDLNKTITNVTVDVISGIAANTANKTRELSNLINDTEWAILEDAADIYHDLKELGGNNQRRGGGRNDGRPNHGGSRGQFSRGRASASIPQRSTVREERPSRPISANEAMRGRPAPTGRARRSEGVAREETPNQKVEVVASKGLVWRSSSSQPYRPAYNIVNKEEVLQQTSEGVIAVSTPRKDIMEDYNSHTTHMGARARFGDQHARNTKVEVVLREAESAAITETIAIGSENLPRMYMADREFVASLMCEYRLGLMGAVPVNSATTLGGVVFSNIFPSANGNEQISYDWLGNSKDHKQLGERMRLLLSGGGAQYNLCAEQARSLDHDLTDAMNRTLQRQLSIDKHELSITSYAMDIEELLGILAKNPRYAESALPAIKADAAMFIRSNTFTLSGLYKDAAFRQLEELRMPAPALTDDIKSKMALSGVPTLAAMINICADELSLDLEMGQTRALIATEHRQLATLASALVDMVNPVTETPSRVTLTTLDSYTFELDKGLLGDHYYLVTRVR